MTTEPLDLDALRALTDAATPGPWAAANEVARLRAVVASVEALCDDADGPFVWVHRDRLRAALTAAQDAPAPTPTEEDRIDAEAQVRAMRYHESTCMFLPDLRERIAQLIDQAWAEVNDTEVPDVVVYGAHPVGYRDGYLDALEAAESIARSTPLTEEAAPQMPMAVDVQVLGIWDTTKVADPTEEATP